MKFTLTFGFAILFTYSFAQKARPSLHLTIGETYYLTSSTTSTNVQGVNGSENRVNVSVTLRLAFKVTAIQDAVYLMDVSYQSIDMRISMADTTIKMNTVTSGKLDTPSLILLKMINKPFELAMSAKGKVKSIKHINEVITAAVNSYPIRDSTKSGQLTSQFEHSFGENAIGGILEQGLEVFPDKPVSKNEQWTVSIELRAPYPMKLQTIYRLFEETAAVYEVYGDGTMSSDTTAKPLEINGLQMKYELSGTTLTDIKVNKVTGWISDIKEKQWISGNIQILDTPKIPGGMIIPMTFTTKTTTTDQ